MVDEQGIKCLLDTSGTLIKTVGFAKEFEYSLEIGVNAFDDAHILAWQQMGINRIVIRYNEDTLVAMSHLEQAVMRISQFIENIAIDLYVSSPMILKNNYCIADHAYFFI